jgi:outer membrane protein
MKFAGTQSTSIPSMNQKRNSLSAMRRMLCAGTVLSTILAAGFIPVTGFAETLQDALASAYNSNPTLSASRAGQRATSENITQARAGWLPTVTLQGSSGTQETKNEGSAFSSGGTALKSKPVSGSVSVSQNIFRGGQTVYQTRSAKAQTRAGEANLVAVEQQILFSAVQAYFDVQRDTAVVKLSGNNVQVLERQLQAAQDRFRVGEITRTDVAQAEARLSGARSRLTQSEAALTASRSSFERSIGHEPVNMGPIQSLPDMEQLPKSEQEAITIAMAASPNVIAARETENASREAIKATRGGLLPQVSVTASYTKDQGSIYFGESETTTVTGRVTVPLYQGGATYSRIRQAKQANSQNRIQIAETERLVRESAINAWEGLRSARATIVSSEQQVRANEIAFNGVSQEAQVGSRTTLDVLNAEQELLDARVTLVRAKRDEQVAAYALLSSVGRLTAESLNLPVTIYQP